MKRFLVICCLLYAAAVPIRAQNQPPFVFSVLGGLFYPSQPQFRDVYGTGSDIIWGGGMSVPIGGPYYIMTDIGYFRAETFPGAVDTSIVLEQRFIHVGMLLKERLSQTNQIRFSGGISYATVKQTTSSTSTPAVSVNGDKSVGYFGGIGLEQMLDPHLSVFGDVVYDYKRSRALELAGDFSGTRLAVGLNFILF